MKEDTTVNDRKATQTVPLIDNITVAILCRHLMLHVYVSSSHSLHKYTPCMFNTIKQLSMEKIIEAHY